MQAKHDEFATLRKLVEQSIKSTEEYKKSTEKYKEFTEKNIKELKESTEEYKEFTEKNIKELKETTKELRETTKELKETTKHLSKSMSDLSSNWGKLVEALIEPSSLQAFKKRQIEVEASSRRVKRKDKEYGAIEIDVLLSNGDTIIPIEVKTTLRVNDVKEHIEKRLKHFEAFFPEYKNKKVYGAVAYINVEEEADKFAYRNGLFVLTLTGNNLVKIMNDAKFKPIDFNKTEKKK